MKESRNWSPAFSKPHLLGLGLAALLLLGAVGCGGGSGGSGGDTGGSSDSDQITKALRSYYEHPDPQKCESFTTERYRDTVYGGSGAGALSACKTHQSERQAMPALNRTAFVNHVRVDGDHAVAEVQGGGITITESLVKSGGGWRLADEQSPFSPPPGGGVTLKPYGPQAFGTPETFTNIPGISSPAAVKIVALSPIDPGQERTGAEQGSGRIANDFGKLGPVEELRFINLPVTLTNTGKTPFRGEVAASGFDKTNHEFTPLDRRDIAQRSSLRGRAPDWTEGEDKGIAPGASTTRYLTFAIPVGDQIVKWKVEPNVLSSPNTVASMEPLDGVTYLPSLGK